MSLAVSVCCLQLTQSRGVGGGEVHRNIVCYVPGATQAGEVVLGGLLVGGVFVFADVKSDNAAVFAEGG